MLQQHRQSDGIDINNNYICAINSINKTSAWKLTADRKHMKHRKTKN